MGDVLAAFRILTDSSGMGQHSRDTGANVINKMIEVAS